MCQIWHTRNVDLAIIRIRSLPISRSIFIPCLLCQEVSIVRKDQQTRVKNTNRGANNNGRRVVTGQRFACSRSIQRFTYNGWQRSYGQPRVAQCLMNFRPEVATVRSTKQRERLQATVDNLGYTTTLGQSMALATVGRRQRDPTVN